MYTANCPCVFFISLSPPPPPSTSSLDPLPSVHKIQTLHSEPPSAEGAGKQPEADPYLSIVKPAHSFATLLRPADQFSHSEKVSTPCKGLHMAQETYPANPNQHARGMSQVSPACTRLQCACLCSVSHRERNAARTCAVRSLQALSCASIRGV